MKIRLITHKLKTTPPKKVIRYGVSLAARTARRGTAQARDSLLDTRMGSRHGAPRLLLDTGDTLCEGVEADAAAELVRMWLNHRFDLLGSGWVRCGYFDNAPGFGGWRYNALTLKPDADGTFLSQVLAKRNLSSSRRIYRMIGDPDYQPIDWQKDFKCGFRWRADGWYLKQKPGVKPGCDIKVPWELSRLQHLPRMAAFLPLLPEQKETICREFRSQCLDFFAQNPPRMGVNWACTMDVGIRTANLTLAYSIFSVQGVHFDKEFEETFLTAIYEHCEHIYHNLEWSEVLTSNHYLSDVAGLLFGAAFLPDGKKRDQWLAFAAREINRELRKQFYEEGSNFEGSVAYHRLSSDIATYCAALLLRLGMLDETLAGRFYGAGRFLAAVTRPDGDFTQLGDNDSGLFFRLSPTGALRTAREAKERYASLVGYRGESEDEPYYDENMNDPSPTLSALDSLFGDGSFTDRARGAERTLVRALSGGKALAADWRAPQAKALGESGALPHEKSFSVPGERLTEGLHMEAFPAFGVYVFRSPELYLLINASTNGQAGNNGHSHNDRLSLELIVNGKAIFEDPGTYVYTASPELRNAFRSTAAHSTHQTEEEQNGYLSLFSMKGDTQCRLCALDDTSICVETSYRGIVCRRTVKIEADRVTVSDACSVAFENKGKPLQHTAGYGKLLR